MYALFNDAGEFLSYSSAPAGINGFYKEIPIQCRDLSKWKWVGNFENGKMMPIFQFESKADEELFRDIKTNYPIDIQLNLIIKQLKVISDFYPHHQLEEFQDMADKFLLAETVLKKLQKKLNNNHASSI